MPADYELTEQDRAIIAGRELEWSQRPEMEQYTAYTRMPWDAGFCTGTYVLKRSHHVGSAAWEVAFHSDEKGAALPWSNTPEDVVIYRGTDDSAARLYADIHYARILREAAWVDYLRKHNPPIIFGVA